MPFSLLILKDETKKGPFWCMLLSKLWKMASNGGSQSFFPEMMCPFHPGGTCESMSHSLSPNEMGSASLLCPEGLKDLHWWLRLLTCTHTMGLNCPIDILPHTSFINLGKLSLLDNNLDIMPLLYLPHWVILRTRFPTVCKSTLNVWRILTSKIFSSWYMILFPSVLYNVC